MTARVSESSGFTSLRAFGSGSFARGWTAVVFVTHDTALFYSAYSYYPQYQSGLENMVELASNIVLFYDRQSRVANFVRVERDGEIQILSSAAFAPWTLITSDTF